MHRNASYIHSRCLLTHGPIIHRRHSTLVSRAGAVEHDRQAIEDSSLWEEAHRKIVERRPVDTQAVIVDDLPGTLEAHRARNRASVIRKIIPNATTQTSNPFLRLSLEQSHHNGGGVSEVSATSHAPKGDHSQDDESNDRTNQTVKEVKDKVDMPIWPADSIQFERKYGPRARNRGRTAARNNFMKSDESLEYTGMPLSLTGSWHLKTKPAQTFQRPWLTYVKDSNGDSLNRLSDEIRAYEAYMKLTSVEGEIAQNVTTDIESIIADSLQDISLNIIGSHKTGLATPLSDIDLTFFSPPQQQRSSALRLRHSRTKLVKGAVESLKKVYKVLRGSSILHNTELVIARVPIVKTLHRATRLRVEIQTMESFQPAQEYIATYLSELPSLRPLYIVLRYSLEIRGLTTVFEGGLGSYSLLMMIVTALKHSSGTFDANDLAGQLLYILHFYGSADLYKSGFSANPPRVFHKVREGWSVAEKAIRSQDEQLRGIDDIIANRNLKKPYLLSLQDPANASNDLGKNAYAIKHIQATFIKARKDILNALLTWENASTAKISSPLDHLVRADYRSFEAHRSRLERSKNPQMSGNHDYSEGRLEEDFMSRFESHEKIREKDGVGATD